MNVYGQYTPTPAAVLAVGRLVQSPMPNTLGYLTCCKLSLLTARKPASSASGLDLMASGGEHGGPTCSMEYCNQEESNLLV